VQIKIEGDTVTVDTPAKLNLFLEVQGKRPDGYHLIETVMVPVTLFDTITISRSERGGVELCCDCEDVPVDGRNAVIRAVESFCNFYGLELPSLAIDLKKRIPTGAGLGGGSSDATATILSLYRLFEVPYKMEEAQEIALSVGADCPFFVHCRPAHLSGIGDQIVEFVKLPPNLRFLLFVPSVRTDTSLVYENFSLTEERKSVKLLVEYMDKNDVEGIESSLFNRLEGVVLSLYKALRSMVFEARKVANFVMSGSGSTFFCIIKEREEEARLRKHLRDLDGRILVVGPYITPS